MLAAARCQLSSQCSQQLHQLRLWLTNSSRRNSCKLIQLEQRRLHVWAEQDRHDNSLFAACLEFLKQAPFTCIAGCDAVRIEKNGMRTSYRTRQDVSLLLSVVCLRACVRACVCVCVFLCDKNGCCCDRNDPAPPAHLQPNLTLLLHPQLAKASIKHLQPASNIEP